MRSIAAIAGIFLIGVILWDGFETIILPRRVTRRVRLTRLFYRCTWIPWSAVAKWMKPGKRREALLSIYGPLSLLLLFFMWAVGLIFSFALLHWAAGSAEVSFRESSTFWTDMYMSGTTFFTLGLGDITPTPGPRGSLPCLNQERASASSPLSSLTCPCFTAPFRGEK